MNELNQAWRKRIEASMAKSGWKVDTNEANINNVRFWLYSVSLLTGPRLAGQLSVEFYRDLQSGSGAIQELTANGQHPGDLLNAAIDDYDRHPDWEHSIEHRNHLLCFMGNYARTTQTWGLLPALSSSPGIHFAVFDWVTDAGAHIIRPMAMHSEEPLSAQELSMMASMQLSMHLARCPTEAPRGFR